MIFYSHYTDEKHNKELIEHLRGVAEDAKRKIKQIQLEDRDFIAEISYLLGASHDFGKYTQFFQEHLLKKKDWGIKSHHSFISSLFAAFQFQSYIRRNPPEKSIYSYLPLIGFFTVLHHHGDLGSLDVDIPKSKYLKEPPNFPYAETNLREKLKAMYEQIDSLRKRKEFIEEDYKKLNIGGIEVFLNSWLEILNSLVKLKQNFENTNSESEHIGVFLLTYLLYSVLIDADKRDAGEVPEVNRRNLPIDLVEKYREKNFDFNSKKLINNIRNEIYEKVINKMNSISLDKHLFTLTAPTGTGKTLIAFSAALKLRARIETEKGYAPRIIYSLPFITIIEQNYEVIQKVLSYGIKDFKENESAYLLKHHHLTELEYKEGDENKPIDEALLLTESWQSEIILTTFVQFLHTIIGFKNKFLKKYHNIAGNIILLDEVQNIPIEYWDIVQKVIKLFTSYFGCYFILLTATKPLILREENTVELLEDNQGYFEKLNRVILRPDAKRKTIDEFIGWFKEKYTSQKSYLIVANTIRSSIEIYEKIKGCNLNNYLFYLSTNIIPKQREARIKAIKELLNAGDKPIVVSTQVIEAGVDIDFDMAIRDIGPIDSIIQVAGRCNREGEKDKGEVYIFQLDHFASYVYGSVHPTISVEMLKNQNIEESNFYELINEYFQKVKPKINDDASKYIWEAMKELRFYEKNLSKYDGCKQVSDFQLIEEKGEYIDIFVELNDEAKTVWREYCEKVYNEEDFSKRQNTFLSIRKKFRSYIISVRVNKEIAFPPQVCGVGYIPQTQVEDYYSIETGFKIQTETFIW